MHNRQILFTAPNRAELVSQEMRDLPGPDEVLVRTCYTAVSAGTERANLIGERHVYGGKILDEVIFPRALGYSGTGIVEKVGDAVTRLKVGQRVVIYFGQHKQYNIVPVTHAFPIEDDRVGLDEAALAVIACFPLLGIRKTRLEIGEAALVAGLGILGQLSVAFCKAAGAVPVIAADPNPARRALALELGADAALDPTAPGYTEAVKQLTGGLGVPVAIEVTGVYAALVQTLGCMTRFGRVSLLGCSRNPDQALDFYHLVHFPGVSLIGANNFARPQFESSPGNWTAQDDCAAILRMMASGRLAVKPLIGEVHSPQAAPEVYHRLAYDYANFPIGVLFDWSQLT